ncbi:MAG: alpha/beta hydrolase family protein, partial [Nitrososphaerales archaeon]
AYDVIGSDIQKESQELRSKIKKVSDITRECAKLAARRESVALEAESQGHTVTARENHFIASMMYGCALWPVWDDDDPNLLLFTEKMTDCYQKYSRTADHLIERIEIPFESQKIYAYLHLPVNKKEEVTRFPCVVMIPGMDTFKEEMVRLYGDKFLERGFAVLATDGPGQGETRARGLKVTKDNFDRAGRSVMDYLVRSENETIDTDKIGIYAQSFGTYWGPRIMAGDKRYTAGVFIYVCHEPGMSTLFNGSAPRLKPRHMWMTGIYDEDEFDSKYCPELTLKGVGEKISSPVLIAAGEDDPLSPIKNTFSFFRSISSPKKRLLVYEGEGHGITDPLLQVRVGDFIDDVAKNREIKPGAYYLERANGWRTEKLFTPPA